MTETTAIIVSVVSACGACSAGICKYLAEREQTHHDAIIQHHQEQVYHAPHNTPVPNLEEVIAHQMEQRNSETDTEVDIKITIHTTNHEIKE